MATQWFYKAFGQELGPLPFRELVQRVQHGDLSAEDWVRADHEQDWRRAETVPGLFYMARRSQIDQLEPFLETSPEEPQPADSLPDELAPVDDAEPEMPGWLLRILERLRAGELDPQRARRVLGELMAVDQRLSEDATAFLTDASEDASQTAADWLAAGVGSDQHLELKGQLAGAIEAALAEIDRRAGAPPQQPAGRVQRMACSLKAMVANRKLAQYGLRIAGALIAGNLALLWLDHWTAREALRFPGLLEKQNLRVFPVIGECQAAEYWFFAADLAMAAAVAAYLGIRWVERHLES